MCSRLLPSGSLFLGKRSRLLVLVSICNNIHLLVALRFGPSTTPSCNVPTGPNVYSCPSVRVKGVAAPAHFAFFATLHPRGPGVRKDRPSTTAPGAFGRGINHDNGPSRHVGNQYKAPRHFEVIPVVCLVRLPTRPERWARSDPSVGCQLWMTYSSDIICVPAS